jgi:nucleoside-diphosphate-sugar epimerase
MGQPNVILLTGGTGVLGRALIPLLHSEGCEITVLTRDVTRAAQPFAEPLDARSDEESFDITGVPHVRLIRGDITQGPQLGMAESDAATLRKRVTHIIHCAAETRFTLPLAAARAVNVEGTRAMLEFARSCSGLRAVACASTVYVSGTRTGLIMEHDLGGTEWVNSYEQSKAEMEVVAREAMRALPLSIYRFSTIIGHSRTGVVTSFNAIHHALRLFYQGLAPMVPGHLDSLVDLLPVEFAARALHNIMMHRFEPSTTYHLAAGAESSCTLDELLDETVRAFERSRPAWRKRRIDRPAVVDADTYALFSRSVAESGNVVLQRAVEAVQAFAWQLAYPKTFDTAVADAALSGTSIVAPHCREFYGKVVEYCVASNWSVAPTDGVGVESSAREVSRANGSAA